MTASLAPPSCSAVDDLGEAGAWSLDLATWRIAWSPTARAIHEGPPGLAPAAWEVLLDIAAEDRSTCLSAVLHCARTGRPFSFKAVISTCSGRQRRVRITGFLAHDKADRMQGTILDLGPHTAAGAPAEREVDRLRAEVRDWRLFAQALPHELQGPLRSARAFARALQQEAASLLPEPQRGRVDRLARSLARVDALAESVLALTRVIDRAPLREEVDLSALALQYAGVWSAAQPERQVEVDIQRGVHAWGDPDLLRLVFANLLANAWKSTRDAAGARLAFHAELRGNEVACCVADNGAGFDASEAQRLFEPFQGLPDNRDAQATGLGLALVRRIVEAHGGRAWARGLPGEGAQFWFTLPAAPPEREAQAQVR